MKVRISYLMKRLAAGTVFVALLTSPMAAQGPGGGAAAPANQAKDNGGFERIVLTAGRSTVLSTTFDITRIAVTNASIADAVVVQPREVLIDGKSAGTVSLIVWGASDRRQYDVVVDPGVTTLQQTFQALFPGEDIRVAMNDESIILTGNVSSNAVMLRAGEIAEATSSKTGVVNMLDRVDSGLRFATVPHAPTRRSRPHGAPGHHACRTALPKTRFLVRLTA